MAQGITKKTLARKFLIPLFITGLLIGIGSVLVSFNNPGFVEKLFGGIALGSGMLSGILMGIDMEVIPGWFITPGGNICDSDF